MDISKLTIRLSSLAITSLICSCASKSPSGFLSNYHQLRSGVDPSGAVVRYIKPGADFKDYDTILFDPIVTIVDADKVDPRAVSQIAHYVESSLKVELGKELRLVDKPGPRTLAVRPALTDIVAGVTPTSPETTNQAGAKAVLSGKVGDAAAFLSRASFECEVLESTTGERLTAVTDQRVGEKREIRPSTTWKEVKAMVDEGAKVRVDRLRAAQAR